MANEEHLLILKQGVQIWNDWREKTHNPTPAPYWLDLSGADLREVNLKGANLSEVDLRETNLSSAILEDADLRWAELLWANLSGARLSFADLRWANLTGVDLRGANLTLADLRTANLSGTNLRGANLNLTNLAEAQLEQSAMVGTTLTGAILTGCSVYGLSAWDLEGVPREQDRLNIAPPGQPAIMVDNLEVAQFVYMLLNHKTVRDAITATINKGVLILGRFAAGGWEVLHAIATALRQMNYQPIIFDMDRPEKRDFTETLMRLSAMVHFIVAEVGGPFEPREFAQVVPTLSIPFLPIMVAGAKPYQTFVHLLQNDWVLLPILQYHNISELVRKLPDRVVSAAEDKYMEMRDQPSSTSASAALW